MTPLRSCTTCSAIVLACFWEPLSPPVMPATISPVLPSLLTSASSAEGGAVHAEVTWATFGDAFSCVTMSVPTARAGVLCAPSSD